MRPRPHATLLEPLAGRLLRGALAKTRPRVVPAGLRVPSAAYAPLAVTFPRSEPHIFVHEGARQRLERRLASASSLPVRLAVTDNSRSMLSFATKGGVLEARVHMMFLDAPAAVQSALVGYVAHHDPEASRTVGRYIDANAHRIRATEPLGRRLVTRGKHHDLLAIHARVNDLYFDGAVDALISFGHARRREAPRRAIKLGGYSARQRLITVHPALDRSWVPRYFVEFVVFHEMLHHVMPPVVVAGRAQLHPAAFRERERQFRAYERAVAWERAHLGRLLRA